MQKVIGGDTAKHAEKMAKPESRYEILAKLVPRDQEQALRALKLKGIGSQAVNYRTYPQGQLAAQVLGFVNDDGAGKYGIEQALDNELTWSGRPTQGHHGR